MEPYPPPDLVRFRRKLRFWRGLAIVASAAAAASTMLWLVRPAPPPPAPVAPPAPQPPAAPPPDRLVLVPADFAGLPRWSDDDLAAAVPALLAACPHLEATRASVADLPARPEAWRAVCGELRRRSKQNEADLRGFFERAFAPFEMRNNDLREGLLTGYYEPELAGSRRKTERFRYPVYLRPNDMIGLDLGLFKKDLAGRRITGRFAGGSFRPYFDRSEIEEGALARRGLELLWVDDPIALFFLQIQGSGQVTLPDGSRVRIGYSGENGFDYTAIGKVLVERGALPADGVSLQSIREWLRANPAEARPVMDQNRAYVFFRVVPEDGAVGALGVVLSPGRSIAVDPKFVPLGLPIYVSTTLPALPETAEPETLFARLFVAADTGGAIRGPLRGDLFWGSGARAEAIAGRMRQKGRFFALLPRAAAAVSSARP